MQLSISAPLIDLDALWVVKRLRSKNYEAYFTGGCVRDLLLGENPKDFDIATSAKPEEIRKIFRNSRLIGRRFVLAHIYFPGNKIIETATFRGNPLNVSDNPPDDLLILYDNVYGNIEQDAGRRDLTINGLFYDPVSNTVIDYIDGRVDLNARLIRAIGDPEIRFQEDPIRILRAIKFASRLEFEIETKTFDAMRKYVNGISRCAPARLREEFLKLLISAHSTKALKLCKEIGIINMFIPELFNDYEDMLMSLDLSRIRNINISLPVALSCLLLSSYSEIKESGQNEKKWISDICYNLSTRIYLTKADQSKLRNILTAVSDRRPIFVKKPWLNDALALWTIYLYSQGKSLNEVSLFKKNVQDLNLSSIQIKPRSSTEQRRIRYTQKGVPRC